VSRNTAREPKSPQATRALGSKIELIELRDEADEARCAVTPPPDPCRRRSHYLLWHHLLWHHLHWHYLHRHYSHWHYLLWRYKYLRWHYLLWPLAVIPSLIHRGSWVGDKVSELLSAGVNKSEIAVLSRKNRSIDAVEKALKERQVLIATTAPAAENPYIQQAVVPLLKLLLDNDDDTAFMDVALLSQTIDSTCLETLDRHKKAVHCSMYQAARSFNGIRPKGVGAFLNRLEELKHPSLPIQADQLADWAEKWLQKVHS
jgi:hypothetical protein